MSDANNNIDDSVDDLDPNIENAFQTQEPSSDVDSSTEDEILELDSNENADDSTYFVNEDDDNVFDFIDDDEDEDDDEDDDDLDQHFEDEEDDGDIADLEFPQLATEETSQKIKEDMLSNIPVGLSVELGRTKISLKEVFELNEGSIIELERLVGEPLDLVINGQTIAQGEVVAIDNNYGLRVTNVLTKHQDT